MKEWKNVLKLFHVIMQIIFLLQDNTILLFLHLESLIELFVFRELSYVLNIGWKNFFFFSVQIIKSNCYIIFLKRSSNIPFKLCLFIKGLIFDVICGSFLISSWFNATVATYWKKLSSSFFWIYCCLFFFIQSEELIYEPPRLKFAFLHL